MMMQSSTAPIESGIPGGFGNKFDALVKSVAFAASAASPLISSHAFNILGRGCHVFLLYQLWESALSNVLGLETLRHGTALSSYGFIHFQGALKKHGGTSRGEAGNYDNILDSYQSGNKVYAWADKASPRNVSYGLDGGDLREFYWSFGKRLCAIEYIRKGTRSMLGGRVNNSFLLRIQDVVVSFFTLFTPVMKFHFVPEDVTNKFSHDDEYSSGSRPAMFAQSDIDVSHIGIIGALRQGVNFNWLTRISQNKSTFSLGCVQLVAAVALTYFCATGATIYATNSIALQAFNSIALTGLGFSIL